MNGHPSEEQLILYYYEDSDTGPEITVHLEDCVACRGVYRELNEFLAGLETEKVPERGPEYGVEVWARLYPRLLKENNGVSRFHLFKPGRPAFFAGLAAALVLAFFLGRFVSGPVGPGSIQTERAGQRVLESTVRAHLDEVQMFLIDFANQKPGQTNASGSYREWARTLSDDNRLYRQVANIRGERNIADFLDQIEFTLLEIANGGTSELSADIRAVRDGDYVELLFKIRFFDKSRLNAKQPNQGLKNI